MKTPSSDLDRDPGLRLDHALADGHEVVRVAGEIDIYSAPALRELLIKLAGPGPVIVDLTEVSFLDSTALGVLVGAMKRQRERGGTLGIVIRGPRVRRLFEVTGLVQVFAIYDSVPDAIAAQ